MDDVIEFLRLLSQEEASHGNDEISLRLRVLVKDYNSKDKHYDVEYLASEVFEIYYYHRK